MSLHKKLKAPRLITFLFFFGLILSSLPAHAQAVNDVVLYRVNAGGDAVDDWEADSELTPSPYLLPESGSFYSNPNDPDPKPSVPEGTPEEIFNKIRLDANKVDPALEWDFPVTPGEALIVRLYFIEWTRCAVGDLLFDIEIEGDIVWADFDIYNHAGNICGLGIMRSFEVTPQDDNLDINFPLANSKPASIAGIEILAAGEPDYPLVTRVAGNMSPGYSGDEGPASEAQLHYPRSMEFDSEGNMYISELDNHAIRRVDAETGIITTIAGGLGFGYNGDDIPAVEAQLADPYDIKFGPDGNLYFVDHGSRRVRMINMETGIISTFAGNGLYGFGGDGGLATNATMAGPRALTFDASGNLFIADANNYRIRRVDAVSGIINTIAGTGTTGATGDGGLAINAAIDAPGGLSFDNQGNLFFSAAQSNRIRRIDASTSIITTVAGNGSFSSGGDGGLATEAQVKFPFSVVVDPEGALYIAEYAGQNIRRVDPITGIITTVEQAELSTNFPTGITAHGKNIYFSNHGNNSVFEIKYEDEIAAPGVLVAAPEEIFFEEVEPREESIPQVITLTNVGESPVDVLSVELSGLDDEDFNHDFSGPVVIQPGASNTFTATFAPDPVNLPPPPPFATEEILYRVNAGGEGVEDWEADTDGTDSPYLIPGTANVETTNDGSSLDASVPEGTPLDLFMSKRIDANQPDPPMEWAFPVTAGQEYEVRMYFAELSRCSVNNRLFHVDIEGARVLESFDVYTEAGEACDVGIMRQATVTPEDDTLNIVFPLDNLKPSIISAIEIVSGSSPTSTIQRSAELTISHAGSNGPLVVELNGLEIQDGSTNEPPTAAFSSTTNDLVVFLTDASSDSDGSITSWSWDFGDGNGSTDQSPQHTYDQAGTHTVTLTVTDDDGATDTVAQDVTVQEPVEPLVISMPEVVMNLDSPEHLPVLLSGVDTENIQSYLVIVSYDPAILEVTGADATGTLSESGFYTVNTTVAGEVSISWASIDDLPGDGTLINLEVDLLSEGMSPLTLSTVLFNEGSPNPDKVDGSIDVESGAGDGPFQEVDGLIVMEAENFHENIPRSDHVWEAWDSETGFSGSTAMSVQPNNGTSYKKSSTGSSPEMQYSVDFASTGSFYVWARVFAPGSGDNTLHMGLNSVVSASKMEASEEGTWTWTNVNTKGRDVTIGVTTTGAHTVNLWMNEDGIIVDKILLTTDPAFVPEGTGPSESPRLNGQVAMKNGGDPAHKAEEIQEVPDEYALSQNYPNPFNPTTTISFDLPEAATVRLEVYDMMGRRIATLVDSQVAAGRHTAQWNARTDSGSIVASGIYIYRLQAGSFEATGRMVLTK